MSVAPPRANPRPPQRGLEDQRPRHAHRLRVLIRTSSNNGHDGDAPGQAEHTLSPHRREPAHEETHRAPPTETPPNQSGSSSSLARCAMQPGSREDHRRISTTATHSNVSSMPCPLTEASSGHGTAPLDTHRDGWPSRDRGNRGHPSPLYEGRAPSGTEMPGGLRSASDHEETHRRVDEKTHRRRQTESTDRSHTRARPTDAAGLASHDRNRGGAATQAQNRSFAPLPRVQPRGSRPEATSRCQSRTGKEPVTTTPRHPPR